MYLGIDVARNRLDVVGIEGNYPTFRVVYTETVPILLWVPEHWAKEIEKTGQIPEKAVEIVESAVEKLPEAEIIAVDAPRKLGKRQEEIEIIKMGKRVIWPTQKSLEASPRSWLITGVCLYMALKKRFPNTTVIETFPSLVRENLPEIKIVFSSSHFFPQPRFIIKDLFDALTCALVAGLFKSGKTKVLPEGVNPEEEGVVIT